MTIQQKDPGGQAGLQDFIAELNSPEFRRDPYGLYGRLRDEAPLLEASGRWLLSRHADCEAVLRDSRWERLEELMCLPDQAVCPTTGSQAELQAALGGSPENFVLDLGVAPSRARLRTLFEEIFNVVMVRRWQPLVEQVADELVDSALAAGEVDLVSALTLPLPTRIICEMLGVPYSDRSTFQEWSRAIVRSADPLVTMSADEVTEQRRAGAEFSAYFRELIAERRQRPKADLLTELVTVQDDAGGLSEAELLAACIMLLVAGHEMTANLLGLGALALARHPDQFALLRDNPGLTTMAVEELLRYDSPAQIAPRIAKQDTMLHGKPIARGAIAVLLLGSANRDPAVFSDPDRLDITRSPIPHLAFGQGHLYCPGATMARTQARVAFGRLARKASRLELAGEPERKETFCIRGLASLPVRLR